MQPAAIRLYYRREFKEQEAALHPGLDHPRTINLREDVVCRAPKCVDHQGLRTRPARRHRHSAQPRKHRGEHRTDAAPEQAQARQAIKERERHLSRYQAALEARADPAVVTQWINEAQRDKQAAQRKLDALPAVTQKREPQHTAEQIGRLLRESTISHSASKLSSHSASKLSTPTRKAHSTKPWASPSATNTQQGPRP